MLATLALVLALRPEPAPMVGKVAPDFSLPAADGKTRSLSDFKGKVVVLEWTNFGCPFVRKHYNSGTMQALQKKATDRGVVWLQICSSGPGKEGFFEASEALAQNKAHKAASTAYLLDPEGMVGRLYAAKATPQVFVIDAKGLIRYAGAADDQPSPDPATLKGAKPYLSLAIDAVLMGKEPEVTTSQPYGCSVKYAD